MCRSTQFDLRDKLKPTKTARELFKLSRSLFIEFQQFCGSVSYFFPKKRSNITCEENKKENTKSYFYIFDLFSPIDLNYISLRKKSASCDEEDGVQYESNLIELPLIYFKTNLDSKSILLDTCEQIKLYSEFVNIIKRDCTTPSYSVLYLQIANPFRNFLMKRGEFIGQLKLNYAKFKVTSCNYLLPEKSFSNANLFNIYSPIELKESIYITEKIPILYILKPTCKILKTTLCKNLSRNCKFVLNKISMKNNKSYEECYLLTFIIEPCDKPIIITRSTFLGTIYLS